MLPMLPPRRPVDSHWRCVGDGACCTKTAEVIMTKEEPAELVHASQRDIVMTFRKVDDKFVALRAAPCPLYAFKKCLVYAVRPYNCRRFICMRPDVKAERFDADGSSMMDRVKTSRVARRLAQVHQRRAMGWA